MLDVFRNLRPVALTLALTIALVGLAAPAGHAEEGPAPVPEEPEESAEAPAAEEAAGEEAAGEPEFEEQKIPLVFRERTLVTVSGRAEMNGIIEFVVQPRGEEPVKVRANVIAKTKHKKITKELVNQFVFALGDRYKVKQSNDKTVRINARKHAPPLAVYLLSQHISGVAVAVGNG